jgi:hypothetical protein
MVDNVVSETDQNKILTSDEIVAFLARAFEDSWKDAASVFDLLEDAKKSQVRAAALCFTCMLYRSLIAYRSAPAAGCDFAPLQGSKRRCHGKGSCAEGHHLFNQ